MMKILRVNIFFKILSRNFLIHQHLLLHKLDPQVYVFMYIRDYQNDFAGLTAQNYINYSTFLCYVFFWHIYMSITCQAGRQLAISKKKLLGSSV